MGHCAGMSWSHCSSALRGSQGAKGEGENLLGARQAVKDETHSSRQAVLGEQAPHGRGRQAAEKDMSSARQKFPALLVVAKWTLHLLVVWRLWLM